jgi:hypothetical protein
VTLIFSIGGAISARGAWSACIAVLVAGALGAVAAGIFRYWEMPAKRAILAAGGGLLKSAPLRTKRVSAEAARP